MMDWAQISLIAGGIATIAALIGGFFKKVLPAIRKVSRFIDRVSGVPANEESGQKEVIGLFARMDHQDAALEHQNQQLAVIKHEVEFNNGSSVKDAVVRNEQAVAELTKEFRDYVANGQPPTTTINVNPGGVA